MFSFVSISNIVFEQLLLAQQNQVLLPFSCWAKFRCEKALGFTVDFCFLLSDTSKAAC